MKKLLIASLLTISITVSAEPLTAFTFVAPASVAVAPALTNLLGVVNAFKAVGTAFALADPAATALLDKAALDLTLSIDIKNIDTLAINSPVYDNSTGKIIWVNNFFSVCGFQINIKCANIFNLGFNSEIFIMNSDDIANFKGK